MTLTEKQKKFLRRSAHGLSPSVSIGVAGLSTSVLEELDRTLEQKELIKIKVRAGSRASRDDTIDEAAERSGATIVMRVGHTAVLYRQRNDAPSIALP